VSVSLDRAASLLGEGTLFGRAAELEAISQLIDPADPGGGALVLHGPPGIGKSALLEAAYRHAAQQGIATLELLGVEAQADLPFADLKRLIHPLLADAAELPVRQRAALLAALGSGEASTPDLFLVALAALNVITDAGARRRLLLIVDDAQWLDRGSAEVLAFVARRLQAEPVVMMVAILDGYESPLLGSGLRDIAVGPLGQDEASALLEAKSPDMNASERQDLLAQAEGNPLALVELAGVLAPAGPTGMASHVSS
jgi:predicted ATPase